MGDAYGIVGPLGFYRRSVFVVDADGIIRWIHRSIGSLSFQPTDRPARRARVRPAERRGRRGYCSSATPRSRARVTARRLSVTETMAMIHASSPTTPPITKGAWPLA